MSTALKNLSLLFPLIMFLLFAGCDKESGDSSSADPASDSAQANLGQLIDETVSAPVTIQWWHFWTDPTIKPTIKAIIADFERENPNITVKTTGLTWADGHEKIAISLNSGSGPDLLELGSDWVPEFVASGSLVDLTANLASTTDQFMGWEPVTQASRIYGQPWILGTRVMFYNTDLLTRAGFESNYLPITFAEFRAFAYRVDSLGPDIYGWGSNAAESHRLYKKFLPFFWGHNASFFSENGEFCVISSTEGGAALKYYKDLHDNCSLVDTQRRLEDAFLAGKVGVVLSGDWLLKRIAAEKPDFNFITGLAPGKSLTGTSFLGGEYLVINSASKNKGAALRLLRFISNAANQLRFCKTNFTPTPSNVETAKDSFFTSDPNFVTFFKQLKSAKSPPFEPTWVYIEDEFEKAVERTLFEDVPPFESLHRARKRIQEISRGN